MCRYRYRACDASQGYAVPIPLFSILSNVILAHADDILPDLLLLLPHLFDKIEPRKGAPLILLSMRYVSTRQRVRGLTIFRVSERVKLTSPRSLL